MNKKNKIIRFMGGFLVVLVLFLLVSPSLQAEEVCIEALDKCTTKAFIAGIFFGGSFFLYMSHCLLGYTWCLKYYAV